MKSLKTNFTNRVSFYAYNDFEDIDYFMDSLEKTINVAIPTIFWKVLKIKKI